MFNKERIDLLLKYYKWRQQLLLKEKVDFLLKYFNWRQKHLFKIGNSILYILNFFIKYILHILCIYTAPKVEQCDILILSHTSAINRLSTFIRLLEENGYSVSHELVLSQLNAFKKRMLSEPSKNIPVVLKFFDAFSKYIVLKYRPRILITFEDASILSPFLRLEMKKYGEVINIAHGFTANTWKFSMTDFDYYFLFGQKSFQNLELCPVRFGNTNIILTGSIFINKDFSLPKIKPNKTILFFSSWTRNEYKQLILRNFEIVARWIQQHPEFKLIVKLHPLEDTKYWEKKSQTINNIKILDRKTGIKDALKECSIAIVHFSSASIESALLNRPVVVVNDSDMPDEFLQIEDFFLPRAKNVAQLNERIHQTLDNYDELILQCEQFSSFHLVKKQGAQEYLTETIKKILSKQDIPSITLPENIQALSNVRH